MSKENKMPEMNGYNLTRNWFNFRFDNPHKTRPIHSDLYFYIVDLWNRLGQKKEFGLPTAVTMECLGIGSYNTYKKTLNELIDFGFIILVQESINQHKSKIVAISNFDNATEEPTDKTLDKAHIKATDKATDSIDKQCNNITTEQENKEQSIYESESFLNNSISDEPLKNEAQEKEKNSGAKKEKDFSEEAINIFNDVCRNLPKVEKITPQRKAAINSRIKEHGLEAVGKAIQMVADSEFLNGKSESGWKASFDWIFKPSNFNKIIEGNYSNKNQSSKHNLKQSAGDAVDALFGVNSFGPDPPIFIKQLAKFNTQEAILAVLQNKESG